ncbi:MAG: hypothetical protein N2691_01010 [Patescibacteria group bacterium]|nr:hypothetical protein [Patescibacteria group bacterium]
MPLLYALIAVNLIMALVTGLTYQTLPPQVPLFYTRPWGEEQLADIWMLALVPFLLHTSFFFNNWLRMRYFAKDSFMNGLLNAANWFIMLSFCGVFLKLILLVT